MRRQPEPIRSWTWPHYKLLMWVIRGLLHLSGGFRITEYGHVPLKGGAIIAANHLSFLDPPAIGAALTRRSYFFAKQELFEVPVLGWFISKSYAFPVDRDTVDRTAIRNAISILQAGELLTMYPEGSRSPDGTLQNANTGAAFIARQAGVPIIPCAIKGTNKVFPRGAWCLHRGRVDVEFGQPICVDDFVARDGAKEGLKTATEAMMDSIAQMRIGLYERYGEECPDRPRHTSKPVQPLASDSD